MDNHRDPADIEELLDRIEAGANNLSNLAFLLFVHRRVRILNHFFC